MDKIICKRITKLVIIILPPSTGGSVVEFSPATREARVRFPSLRAGSRLGFMREMRNASGEATRRAAKPRENSRLPRGRPGFDSRPEQSDIILPHFLPFDYRVKKIVCVCSYFCLRHKVSAKFSL